MSFIALLTIPGNTILILNPVTFTLLARMLKITNNRQNNRESCQ